MTCPTCGASMDDECVPCAEARAMFEDALATLCGAVIARQAELMDGEVAA